MSRKNKAGYARGEETKTRILNVAINLFGARGYDSVSTRDIADSASVPPASLRYYFENKQGLYIACLNHIQTLALQAMEPALQQAELLFQSPQPDTDRLIEAFCELQQAQIDYSLGGSDGGASSMFMVRHDLPSVGGASNFKGDGTIARRMIACFIQLIMAISGNKLDTHAALVVAGLINGQMTHVQQRRERLAEIGWDLTPERLQWLKQTISSQTRVILQLHSADAQSTAS